MALILVPTDFSEAAARALDYAEMLAVKLDAGLLLFHCYGKTPPDENLLDVMARAIRKRTGRDCTIEARKGNSADEILKSAERNSVGFIVLGATGASGIQRNLWGGTAAKVILKSSLPVIAVPEKIKKKTIKRMVLATGKSSPDRATIGKIGAFASAFGAKLVVTHVANEKTGLSCDATVKKIEESGYRNLSCEVLYGKDIAKKLDGFLSESRADMLVLVRKDKPIVKGFFNPDLTRRLIFHSSIPVLVFYESLLGTEFSGIHLEEILG